MDLQVHLSTFLVTLFSFALVNCANVYSCTSMRSWFPETSPSNFTEGLPYQLSIGGREQYISGSLHTVTLHVNGSMTGVNKTRSFIGFIVSAVNSVKNYTNGHFVKEDFPAGVEEASCGDIDIVQNSTSSGNWTRIKLLWKAPKDGYLDGKITFRASVLEKTNPLNYYEGITAELSYQCHVCAACLGHEFMSSYPEIRDSYGCPSCHCSCDFACPEIYDPLCGKDGKTYSNRCSMVREMCKQDKFVLVDHKGKCPSRCSYTCTKTADAQVCGTDNKTYHDKCHLEFTACVEKTNVTVSHYGTCGAEELGFPVLSFVFTLLAFFRFSF